MKNDVGGWKLRSAFLALVLSSAFALSGCEQEQPEIVPQIRAIKTITVTDVASGQVRKYPGVVQATDTSALSFQVGGNVRRVNVKLGDQVKKGLVLAILDKRPFQLDVQAAKADLDKERSNLAQKKQEWERQRKLFSKGWVAKAKMDQAQRAYETAVSQVNYARSKLNLARRDLTNTVLRAPFAGIIAKKSVDPFVEVRAGQKLFDLDVEGTLQVAFDIPETIISRVAVGMKATVTLATGVKCVCQARITEIGKVAGAANAFPVKADLLAPPTDIRSGMTAEVALELKTDAVEAAYLIPLSALAPGAAEREGYVFVFDEKTSTVKRAGVKGRGVTGNLVHIIGGLKAGDIIAVAGVSYLSDGQKVKLMSP